MPFDKVLDFREHVTGMSPFGAGIRGLSFLVLSSLRFVRGLDLLSSTPGITVVVGFPFIASPESPCASETRSLVLTGNGRTSTAPHAYTVVAWPVAGQGFYGGQPTGYPAS